jgi:hypothetical protein
VEEVKNNWREEESLRGQLTEKEPKEEEEK